MDLDHYLSSGAIGAAEFAARVGLTEASVSRIRKGKQNITLDVMRRIIAATGGKVTAGSLIAKRADEAA